MPPPFWLGTRLAQGGLSFLGRMGRSIGIGRSKVRIPPRGIDILPSRMASPPPGLGVASDIGKGTGRLAANIESRYKLTKNWFQTTGKEWALSSWDYAKKNPKVANLAIAGGAGLLGYATSSDDASAGQVAGRTLAFAGMGSFGTRMARTQGRRLGAAAGRFAGGNFRKGFGHLAKAAGINAWSPLHSIAAGAFYGLVSDQATVAEGAVFGGMAHLGVSGMRRTWGGSPGTGRGLNTWTQRGKVYQAYRKQGLLAAARRMPLASTGLYGGMLYGAYGNLGEGNATGLNVLGGGLLGGATGMALGGGAKFAMKHPWITVGTAGPTLALAGSAAQAAGTVMQAGAPGFDTLNADGDLGLALHKMRHG